MSLQLQVDELEFPTTNNKPKKTKVQLPCGLGLLQVRLCKRYRRLVARGKNVNQVVVAIAREMAAFVWAIAREVEVAP